MSIKNKLHKGLRYIFDSDYRFLIAAYSGKYDNMLDEEYLKRLFKARMGYELDLDHPKTFNEKLQWLKLYDRKPEYTKMVDKYEVKKYVSELIGEKYIIPTLGVWDNPEDIEWDALPNSFVLKVTHDSGGLVICKNKAELNINETIHILRKSLQRDYYLVQREWPYKDVKKRIIAEKYMTNDGGCLEDRKIGCRDELTDYKFMCFNGRCEYIFTGTDRYSEEGLKITFYDREWNMLPFKRHYPSRDIPEPKPTQLNAMIRLAELLAEHIPFVRVDFYQIGGQIYFGEITFYPGSGLEEFDPVEWDYKIGKLILLP